MRYHVHVLVDGLQVDHYWTDDVGERAKEDARICDAAAELGRQWRLDIYDSVEDYTTVLASDPVSPTSVPIEFGDWGHGRN